MKITKHGALYVARQGCLNATGDTLTSAQNELFKLIVNGLKTTTEDKKMKYFETLVQVFPYANAKYGDDVKEYLGYIPAFASQAANTEPTRPLAAKMLEQYGMAPPEFKGLKRKEWGVLQDVTGNTGEDKDPDLAPLAVILYGDKGVFIYEFGIVCIFEQGETDKIYRFD